MHTSASLASYFLPIRYATSSFSNIHVTSLLLSFRGPWGALSPIPENNAIAVNTQVPIFFKTFCHNNLFNIC